MGNFKHLTNTHVLLIFGHRCVKDFLKGRLFWADFPGQHCRLTICRLVEFVKSEAEANPNNNLMIRRAGLSSCHLNISSYMWTIASIYFGRSGQVRSGQVKSPKFCKNRKNLRWIRLERPPSPFSFVKYPLRTQKNLQCDFFIENAPTPLFGKFLKAHGEL